MPTYEYTCIECGNIINVSHKMNEKPLIIFYKCFEKNLLSYMQKGLGGGIALHFKGTGFYETDYKDK